MSKIFRYILVTVIVLFNLQCKRVVKDTNKFTTKDINHIITQLTDLMVHDVTNPPLAARFFSYATLSGYEIVAENNSAFKNMHGLINGYPAIKKPDSIQGYSYQLAALLAIMETAKKIQPSGKLLENYQKHFLDSLSEAGYPDETVNASQKYAAAVSKQVLAYAKADGYSKISNLPRYTSSGKEGSWYPTPPGYMAAVEPYFNTVRPFTLDSASQFKPAPPVAFSTDKNSGFYKLMLLNYKDTLSEEHRKIAAFWDCNPFALENEGHMMVGLKKISPGAHWLGIAGIACVNAKKSFDESMQILTTLSVGLMDAFMCCWDEKFRSDRIRPETAIRRYISTEWKLLLQTPPFPEYPSGHSVISAASAYILTHYFGDNFSYTDSVEVHYGLPPRTFSSFNAAASEAGISRFYGGIHFMDAIDNGLTQGRQVGEWVIKKMGK